MDNIEKQDPPKKKDRILLEYYITNGQGAENCINLLIRRRYKLNGLAQDIKRVIKGHRVWLRSGSLKINTKNTLIKKPHTDEP